jgi:hypothetical protein
MTTSRYVSSTRGDRFDAVLPDYGEWFPRAFFQGEAAMTTHNQGSEPMSRRGERAESDYSLAEEHSTRVSKWTSILYLAIALATPVLVYSGPDVMSPATPAFANAAIDGHLTLHRLAPCPAKSPCPAASVPAARK